MRNPTLPKLTAQGLQLDTSAESFGPLKDSTDILNDTSTLRKRMAEDGYLYLPGYLDRELVLRARKSVTEIVSMRPTANLAIYGRISSTSKAQKPWPPIRTVSTRALRR
jgi:hypothetical protein